MAGLWNRLAAPSEGADRISAHLLKASMFLAARGIFSDQQLLQGINRTLANPLTAQEIADLGTIRASIVNAATLADKVEKIEIFDALNIAAESGALTNEAVYRAQLGI
jgi:hypothetical protein